ncbi:hypothetical protein YUYDRAFT_03348 [Streptomyces sp. ScaeMP-e48]|nr:hypothetical protein YUYDRAFT_03348 [Streptomyces sp. ScaeMP-e48]
MNSTRINSLLLRLQIADRQNRAGGFEGMVLRKTEAVQILKELFSLDSSFRYRLMLAEADLYRASYSLRNQRAA